MSRILLSLAALFTAWTAVVAITGGYRGDLLGVRVSFTSVWRPLLPALVILAIYFWHVRRQLRDALGRLPSFIDRNASLLAFAAASFSLIVASAWGVHTAGGSDSYGYVSQADLWLRGRIITPRPLPEIPALGDSALSPLGYVSGQRPGTIVPLYPPGLPLLMAAAKWLFGACGVYFVVPICAGLLAWMTYRLGRQLASRAAGLAAAVLMACSPITLFMSTAPMSDVPASATWAVATVSLLRSGRMAAVMAGLATGLTILIRPTLLPVAVVGALVLMLRARGAGNPWRAAFTTVFTYGVSVLPGMVIVALVNWRLYGSPVSSGYGDLGLLFGYRHGLVNLWRWGTWLVQAQTVVVFIAVVPLVLGLLRDRDAWPLEVTVLIYGSIVAVASAYLFYRPFGEWWWLRFQLPAFPALIVAMVAGARSAIARIVPMRFATIAGILATVLLTTMQLRFAVRENVFDLWEQGERTHALGRYIRERTRTTAVFFAGEQSGSIRVYGERLTIHAFRVADLDGAVAALKQAGYHPYLVLESWEHKPFAEWFSTSRIARDTRRPIAEFRGPVGVSVYDLSAPGSPDFPEQIPPTGRTCR